MKKGIIYNFFKFVASFQYKIADVVGIQSKSNFEIIKNKVLSKKVEVLNNWNSDQDNDEVEDNKNLKKKATNKKEKTKKQTKGVT